VAGAAEPGQRRPAVWRDVQADGSALPRRCNAERALQDARRHQHGRPHEGGQGTVPDSAVEAWWAGCGGAGQGGTTWCGAAACL